MVFEIESLPNAWYDNLTKDLDKNPEALGTQHECLGFIANFYAKHDADGQFRNTFANTPAQTPT